MEEEASTSGAAVESPRWVRVGDAPLRDNQRLHVCVEGRYVTLLRATKSGALSAIDSVCFHAGGPLGIGDIEDVDGKPCLVCPWHFYRIDAVTGEKYFQSASFEGGKLVAGGWKSNGVRQRVHEAEERADGIFLRLLAPPGGPAVASDEYAHSAACGERMAGGGGGGGGPGGRGDGGGGGGGCVGADGKRLPQRSGHLLQQQQQEQQQRRRPPDGQASPTSRASGMAHPRP